MSKSNKGFSLLNFALGFMKIVPSFFSVVNQCTLAIDLDIKRVNKNLYKIIFLYILLLVILNATWLSLMIFCYILLTSVNVSTLASLSVIFIFNLLILIITGLIILNLKKNMEFQNTRYMLKNIKNK